MARRVGPKIQWFRGDTYPKKYRVLEDGTALDITGFAFAMGISTTENPTGVPDVVSWVGTITDAAAGEFSIGPANAGEADQAVDTTLFYDLQMTDGSGQILTTWKNTITFTQDITK